jgi:hypothetical protein
MLEGPDACFGSRHYFAVAQASLEKALSPPALIAVTT